MIKKPLKDPAWIKDIETQLLANLKLVKLIDELLGS